MGPVTSPPARAASFEGTVENAFDAAPVALCVIDADGRVEAVNRRLTELLGHDAADLLAHDARDALHLDANATSHGRSATIHVPDGSSLALDWAAAPMRPTESGPGSVVVALTVADTGAERQQQANLLTARRAVSDLEWTADITQAMAETLDETQALARLARLAVPRLGDVALVDLIDDEGMLHRVAAAAAPGIDASVTDLATNARSELASPTPAIQHSIEQGRVFRLRNGDMQDPALLSDSARDLLAGLGATTALLVPLAAHGRLLGLLGLIRRDPDSDYSNEDFVIATDISRRAGLMLDHARMYENQVSTATTLQQALLPTVPENVKPRMAARYLPARNKLRVGGDWYDVFPLPGHPGHTVLVIGDVAGHDLDAATGMAAIRNLLRGVVLAGVTSPAQVLQTVDRNLLAMGVRRTASCVLMCVSPAPADDESGEPDGFDLVWSNAGHPPPALVTADGHVTLFREVHGAILGSRSPRERRESRLRVRGASLLLYSDGLIERREEDIDVGLARLRRALGEAEKRAPNDPVRLIDEVLTRMPPSPEDDTAVLTVSLTD